MHDDIGYSIKTKNVKIKFSKWSLVVFKVSKLKRLYILEGCILTGTIVLVKFA